MIKLGKKVIIYHADFDGIFSAAILLHKFKDPFAKKTKLMAAMYDDLHDLSNISKWDTVYIVDFSFSQTVMTSIFSLAKEVYWFDHHITASKIFVPDLYKHKVKSIIDLNKSACGITWDEMFPDEPRPRIIDLVEDRDLWSFKYGDDTRAIHEFMSAAGIKFPTDPLVFDLLKKNNLREEINKGRAYLSYMRKMVENIVWSSAYYGKIENFPAIFVNTPILISEVGDYILMHEKDPVVVVLYRITEEKIFVSLRSKNIDVSRFAEEMGGGGHRHAAGFSLNYLSTISDLYKAMKAEISLIRWRDKHLG